MKITSEKDGCGTVLPPRPLLGSTLPMEPGMVDPILVVGDGLLAEFKRSTAYRDTVFRAFQRMIAPEQIIALADNPVFGLLWRAICQVMHVSQTC